MNNNRSLITILVVACIIVFSCTKHHDTPAPAPPEPERFDTLGPGWQRIKIDTTLNFEDIFFVDSQTGFLCGDKYLGKSTDGGLTWKRCIPDSLNGSFINLYFADANNGWVFGDPGYFLRTRNGGSSWEKINRANTRDGQFFDANNGYVIIVEGLYKTSDGGVTFQYLNISSGTALFFLNPDKGWFGGTSLKETENAGLSFTPKTGISGVYPYAMQFTDDTHGWLSGNGNVYRTVDGGTTLEAIVNNVSTAGGDIQFFDNNSGFILSGGRIYSSTDGGKTLTQLCAIHKATILYEIHFTDLNHGWTAGHGGYVYRYVKP